MKSYLDMASRHMSVHSRRTRLTITSVAMAVALVVGIFSMLDSLIQFDKAQVMKNEGNYHILVRRPTTHEMQVIKSRIDVAKSGSLRDLDQGTMNNRRCAFVELSPEIAPNLNFTLSDGHYPNKDTEVMVEKWVMDKSELALHVGSDIFLTLPDGRKVKSTISGVVDDIGATKAAGIPGVFLSHSLASSLKPKTDDFFILFKDGVKVLEARASIAKTLSIDESRFANNEGLLALTGQSKNDKVQRIYAVGAVLFVLVLTTGVMMIYNNFNISVMQRVRQFGLLRCIGASKAQVNSVVKREGLYIIYRGIPIGVIGGLLMTFICSAVLKYYNRDLFGGISLMHFSVIGIFTGVLVGCATVFLASLAPARKAAAVSPIHALTGRDETVTSKRRRRGILTKVFSAEVGMGIGNVLNKKKTLVVTSCSIALSIVLFLCFSLLVNPQYMGMSAIKDYTADVSVRKQGNTELAPELLEELSRTPGVATVYGRMTAFVTARSTDLRQADPASQSWLLSYDKRQFEWARDYVTEGTIDEGALNKGNGIIAVTSSKYKPHVGDKVDFTTKKGTKSFTVMAVCGSVPYKYDSAEFSGIVSATYVTTEKLFTEITGKTSYTIIDMKLTRENQEKAVSAIKKLSSRHGVFQDRRQLNRDVKRSFLTIAVFIYGFVGVIGLIGLLNMYNTMSTSVVAKTRYLGLMRAVGMSASQLTTMVTAEAVTYALFGCLLGCSVGSLLQKALAGFLAAEWSFPVVKVLAITVVCVLAAVISVISPLRKTKTDSITEVMASF